MNRANPMLLLLALVSVAIAALLLAAQACAQVERIWLSHRSNDPAKLSVSWMTNTPGDSTVRFGPTKDYGQSVHAKGNTRLHHVEIPLPKKGGKVHYAVSTGNQVSGDNVFNGYSSDVLRVAVVADWQSKPTLKALENDKIHLLMTVGDNIPNLYNLCGRGEKECTLPFEQLIDAYPAIFRSIAFMPALGNHDRQIRPVGDKKGKPPAEDVHDTSAIAFCKFFNLPDKKWMWHFDLPNFQVRFIAVDLNHVGDRGTTWQSCHDFKKGSEQFETYKKWIAERPSGFLVTIHNEHNGTMRELDRGKNKGMGPWGELFQKNSLVISGCGYYGEREEVKGTPYLNTSLAKPMNNNQPKVAFHANEPSYVLMTIQKDQQGKITMRATLKNLVGKELDRIEIKRK